VTILVVLILVGALSALVSGLFALRAYFSLRRTRKELGETVLVEVEDLGRRAAGIEESLQALDERARALPVRIDRLQRNLAALSVLTGALAASLDGTRRVLTPVGLKSSISGPLARALYTLRDSVASRPRTPGRRG